MTPQVRILAAVAEDPGLVPRTLMAAITPSTEDLISSLTPVGTAHICAGKTPIYIKINISVFLTNIGSGAREALWSKVLVNKCESQAWVPSTHITPGMT